MINENVRKILSILLTAAMLTSILITGAVAAGSSYQDLNGVVWSFDESSALSSIQDSGQSIESARALLVSAKANGTDITAIQSNGFDNVVVGHKANEYILIPEGITDIGNKSFYDFNYVKAVSFPSTVAEIGYNAFDVLGREINNATVVYGVAQTVAESWSGDNSTAVYDFVSVSGSNFAVVALDNGTVFPCGNYYVPDSMKTEAVTTTFSIKADTGYEIDSLTVDGNAISTAEGQTEYLLAYTFSETSASIEVCFKADESLPSDTETISLAVGKAIQLDIAAAEQVSVNPDAVASNMDISDIYDAPKDNASGYTASMGVSTGDWYVQDGILYEMVFATNGSGEHGDLGKVFQCKAEIINYLYETEGWIYGVDYHLIRMYHFDSTVTGGNRKGSYDFHCAFVYREVDDDGEYENIDSTVAFYSEKESTTGISNNSSLFVQGTTATPSSITVENLYADNHTRPDGPQEATNFYGIGSSVLVDGGSSDQSYATTLFPEGESTSVTLIDPWIVGGSNPVYVLASGQLHIQGGTLFTAFSGGHGPYASLQGQITINADENLVDESGNINTVVDNLKETALADIPGRFGWAVRNTYEDGSPVDANDYTVEHSTLALDEAGIAAYEEENGDVTVISTANSSGSLLVTDTGGGVIVANKLSGTAYSTGSSGIYSMGGGSYIYVYNSRLESHIEPVMNSVGEGYIFAFNSSFTGPVGILSSGGSNHVNIYNSQITTELDFDMDFYDLTDPMSEDQIATYQKLTEEVESSELVNSNYLMIFPLNGDDMNNFVSNWFSDKTQVPGKNGGNIAIISTTSPSGITIDSTKLTNNAYARFGGIGTPNWLIAAAGGTSTFNFRNQNDNTCWDLTGQDTSTTELYGNIYCAAAAGSGMWVTSAGSAVVNFENSQWIGTIENCGDGVSLYLDKTSQWTVTGSCAVNTLYLAEGAQVNVAEGCEVVFIVDGRSVKLSAGLYENVTVLVTKNGEEVLDGIYAGVDETMEKLDETTLAGSIKEMDSSSGEISATTESSSEESSDMTVGELQFSTGTSNCTHEMLRSVTDVEYSLSVPGVAEVREMDGKFFLYALTVGETVLTLRVTYSDGSEEIIQNNITVS